MVSPLPGRHLQYSVYSLKLLKCPLSLHIFVIILFITVLIILLFITIHLYSFSHMQSSPSHLHIYCYIGQIVKKSSHETLFWSPSKIAHTSSHILVNNSQGGVNVCDHAENPFPDHLKLLSGVFTQQLSHLLNLAQ